VHRPSNVIRGLKLFLKLFLKLVTLSIAATTPALSHAAPGDTDVRGPDVTIIEGEDRVIYEYRQNGELRMIRIVPSIGKPYYLVPRDETQGFGDLEKADMLIPRWTIIEF
jgi:hypothetical protein